MKRSAPIGIFDSGYGGLTILAEIQKQMPQYDYLYLGDNARAPYGTRSFEVVYNFTLQAVEQLFKQGCPLVILACNTASAKALRTIQQNDLQRLDSSHRVLGVIRPTVEALAEITHTGHVGVLGTLGTIQSQSYPLEIKKLYPQIKVFSQACPMWVPLVENNEHLAVGADYFVQKEIESLLAQSPQIDTIVLGCTHYPLLIPKILQFTPPHIQLVAQGSYVARSLSCYLQRHPDMAQRCSQGGTTHFLTTESPDKFMAAATVFLNTQIKVSHVEIR